MAVLPHSAYLEISAIAEDLESLSLQDGPQSGTIIFIIHPATHPPTHPGAKLFKLIYLSNIGLDLPRLLNLSLGYLTKTENSCK